MRFLSYVSGDISMNEYELAVNEFTPACATAESVPSAENTTTPSNHQNADVVLVNAGVVWPPPSVLRIAAPVVYAPPPLENHALPIRTCDVPGPVSPTAWVIDPAPWTTNITPPTRYS